jgi:hypothetical protein
MQGAAIFSGTQHYLYPYLLTSPYGKQKIPFVGHP